MKVTKEQVIAFRLERLGLSRRAPDVRSSVGHVGLPDFPPGAALAALAPRLGEPSPGALEAAYEEREVVRARAMRGAPVVVRAEDYDVFVTGMLPPDEKSLRVFLGPALTSVNAAGMPAVAAVELVTAEASRALGQRRLDRDALHAALRKRLPKALLPYCRACDSHHVHPSMLYAAALRGRFVIFPREEGSYFVARADHWLPSRKAQTRDAPAELVRRFLRAYGPATVSTFAAWAGIGGGQPQAMWKLVEDELAPVELGGATRWILDDDRKRLTAGSESEVVRIVSPGDPALQMRDRELLVPDKLAKVIWKNLAPTGVLFVGPRVAGVVRAKKKKDALAVEIELVKKLDAKTRATAEREAARLAAVRGAKLALSWA